MFQRILFVLSAEQLKGGKSVVTVTTETRRRTLDEPSADLSSPKNMCYSVCPLELPDPLCNFSITLHQIPSNVDLFVTMDGDLLALLISQLMGLCWPFLILNVTPRPTAPETGRSVFVQVGEIAAEAFTKTREEPLQTQQTQAPTSAPTLTEYNVH